jgi:hypothetical protein
MVLSVTEDLARHVEACPRSIAGACLLGRLAQNVLEVGLRRGQFLDGDFDRERGQQRIVDQALVDRAKQTLLVALFTCAYGKKCGERIKA